ncbi:MAG: hypothetical protein ACYTXE_41675 [Nostoc sp.]
MNTRGCNCRMASATAIEKYCWLLYSKQSAIILLFKKKSAEFGIAKSLAIKDFWRSTLKEIFNDHWVYT